MKILSSRQYSRGNSLFGQEGLVSFLVTMIMMMVITLIVVGFTQLTIQSRQDALDKQLSTQALYAAESGVNTVRRALIANPALANDPNNDKSTCNPTDPSSPFTSGVSNILDASAGISYTCLLVTLNSQQIQSQASTNSSRVVGIDPVNTAGASVRLTNLSFIWSSNGAGGSVADCTGTTAVFPQDWGTCPYGLLRVDMFRAAGTATADDFRNATRTVYISPKAPANVTFAAAVNAYRAGASCSDASRECTTTITVNDAAYSKYYLRISAMYLDIPNVSIVGQSNESGVLRPVAFRGQTTIDATGKAQDVLRRVKVQISDEANDSELTPNAAIHSSADLCKRFVVYSGNVIDKCND